jgi:hypothetical protein
VIVAVVAMRVMQAPIDQVVDVIAVRDGEVSAIVAMNVTGVLDRRRMAIRVHIAHVDPVLRDRAILALMVEMPIVEVVDMAVVLHRNVTAVFPVLMRMVRMDVVSHRIRSISMFPSVAPATLAGEHPTVIP